MTLTDQAAILLNSVALERFLVAVGVASLIWFAGLAVGVAWLWWISR